MARPTIISQQQFTTAGTANTGTVDSTITVPSDATFAVATVLGHGPSNNFFSAGKMTLTKGAADTDMTSVSGLGDASNGLLMLAMYYLSTPDVGTNKTLKWDWDGTSNSSDTLKVSLTFFKDVDTASPMRSASGGQAGGAGPWVTGTMTATSDDLIFTHAGGIADPGEGSITSWTGATTYAQQTAGGGGILDGAFATSAPTGNQSVTATPTQIVDGGIVAMVIKGVTAGSPYTLTADQASFTLTGQAAGLAIRPWDIVGVGTSVSTAVTAHTLTLPAGVQQGDLLVAVISSRIASTTSITLPTGGEWTLVAENKSNNVLTTSSALASGMMAYCVRGASDPNLTFTHPTAPSVALGRIVAYRGVNTSSPKDTQNAVLTATNTTSVNVAGVTTAGVNELLVIGLCGGQEAAWSAVDATDPSVASVATDTTTRPTANTWIERADIQSSAGSDTSLAVVDGVRATAGATGNITATASIGAGHVIIIGAFKPAIVSLAPYTLTADQASFTLTGQTAGLKYGRVLTAAQGAFALTGQTATLRQGYVLTATTQGAFALTGQTAALRKGRLPLVAAQGSFNVNGQAAALSRGYSMVAAQGAFVLTGQTATLKRGYTLAAAQGAFALTGQAVALRKGRVPLVAAQGSFTLTGQTAVLRAVRKLTAAQGAFTLTGQAVVLAVKLPAAQASFAVNGQAVTLRYSHKLVATQASFLLTGQVATFKRTRVMPAAQASFLLSGPAVNLVWSASGAYTLPAGVGFFTLTGQTATLRYTRKGVSAQGSFLLNGQTALLKRSRITPAATGMFALTGQSANLVYTQVSPGDYVLTANRGTFTLTGQLVELTRTTITPPAVLEAQPGRLTFGRRVSVRRW